MFTPKLIVTDLDGTTLRNDKSISLRTTAAFHRCEKLGIPIAIATARYILGAKAFAKNLHATYQILTDGTLIFSDDKLIYSNAMSIEVTNAIIAELKARNLTSHIAIPTTHGLYRYPDSETWQENYDVFTLDEPFPYPANKMVVEIHKEGIAEEIADKCHCAQLRYRGEDRYTFFDPSASKLGAILFLTNQLGITLDDVLVFGDDLNDMEMISHCGCGIAMENALPEVKAVADIVTDSNEKDGVAKILEQISL